MEILKLTFSNFKCFHGTHSLDFREFGPGLYYLAGKNYKEPELGQNGAGKSTIWDILHWIFFGTSLRGTKTTQLMPWGHSGKPSGDVLVRHNGSVLKIYRTYRPSKITTRTRGKLRDVTQEQLEDLLGFTSDIFQNSIVLGQFSKMFFDLKPREKMTVFSELLDLDFWDQKAREAGATRNTLKEDKNNLERQLAKLEGIQHELNISLNEAEREYETDLETSDITHLKSKLTSARKRRRNLMHKRDLLSEQLEERTQKDNVLADKIGTLAVRVTDLVNEGRDMSQQVADIKSGVTHQKDLLAALMDSASGVCPTCGQAITEMHRRKEAGKIRRELEKLKQQLVSTNYEQLIQTRDRAEVRLNRLKSKYDVQQSYKIQRELDEVSKEVAASLRNITSTRDEIYNVHTAEKYYEEKVEKIQIRINTNRKKQRSIKRQIQEISISISHAQHWVTGFRDVRLYEIYDALQSLQVETNSYLADLGMENWQVNMEVERETKKGKLNRGLRIMVDPGVGSDTGIKPWEAWSGGEGQRLTLSGTLALSNTILRQLNTNCNIQVWDEKLYWMSGTGQDDMLELLQQLAKNEGRQIWLIDQHNLDFPFDGVVTIVKDKNGSRIEF